MENQEVKHKRRVRYSGTHPKSYKEKYKEHNNDHQKQIIKEFGDLGYILELRDFNKLGKLSNVNKSLLK